MDELESKIEMVLESIVNKTIHMDNDTVAYAPDIVLTRSQIHVIDAIGQSNEINITDLSRRMGVIKSTISRRVSELEQCGYIEKYHSESNKKEIYLRLTDLGKRAFSAHVEFHAKRQYMCYEKMKSYSVREKDLILEFLTLYRDSLTKYYDNYKGSPK